MKRTLLCLILLAFIGTTCLPMDAEAAKKKASRKRIAYEGSSFSFTGTKTVRFGTKTRYVTKKVTKSGLCTTRFFGSDPAPYQLKECTVKKKAKKKKKGGGGGSSSSSSSTTIAPVTVNGTCGSSHGASFSSAPSTNLCTSGTASSVTGSGPYVWSCTGSGGGATANCSGSSTAGIATALTLSGPSSGTISVASTNFTVGADGTISGTVVVTPSSNSGGGSFSPTTLSLTSGTPTGTFTYTPASTGAKTISVSNSGGLTNPSSITYTVSEAAATALTLSGPSGGTVSVASTNFTVGGNGAISGTVVVTPGDASDGGTFTPTTVSLTSGSPTATFTYTPGSTGSKTVSITNNGSLTNPASLTYTSSASVATTVTITGPTSGTVGVASSNFTVGANAAITGTVTVTPSDSGAGGTFTPTTVDISSASPTATFTYTAVSTGLKSLTLSNNGSLSNPSAWSFTVVVVGSSITTFNLTADATGVSTPFTVGQSFQMADVPTGSIVVATGATVQVTPKNYWPDGSLKFAIIAGTSSLVASTEKTITLSTGSSSSGTALGLSDLQTTGITASVSAGAFGSASWSGSDWASPFETWVSGDQMSSWTYRKQIGSDTHLVAWMEVRLFAGGVVEVLPWIENGYLLVTGPTSKSATYTFTLGGTERFSQAIDLPHHTRTPLVNGTITSHWLGTAYDVIVKHESDYLEGTGVVPAYLSETSPSVAAVTGLPSSFTPLQLSNWPAGMGSGGYHASIGLLPEWDVVYLTSTAPSTYKGVIFNGYSLGRFPIHYRDESDGNTPPRLSQHPMLNIRPPEAGWETTPATSGTAPGQWSLSHQPSAGYLAYLITGRRYFLDEVQFAASTNAIYVSSTTREGGSGIFKSSVAGNERHVAWTHRALGQAITATPDSDTTMLTEYRTQLNNNIDFYHTRYIGASNDPLNPRVDNGGWVEGSVDTNSGFSLINGTVSSGATTTVISIDAGGFKQTGSADDQFVGWDLTISGESRTVTDFVVATNTFTVSPGFTSAPAAGTVAWADDDVHFVTVWQQDFITASWGYLKDLALQLGTTPTTRLDSLFTWKAESVVGRLGFTGATEYIYRDYAPYYIGIAPTNTPDWDGGTGPWFADWGEIHDATYAGQANDGGSLAPYLSNGANVEGALRTFLNPEFSSAEALPAIAYAVKHGITGAEAGYQRLTTASNWADFVSALDVQPVWAVSPSALPAWRRGLAVNQWTEISGTASSNAVPTRSGNITFNGQQANGGGNSIGFRLDAYGGATVDTRRSTVWVSGGGHGDYFGNELINLDLRDDSPSWAEHAPGSPAGDFPSIDDPTTHMGYTLSGSTTSTIYIFGTNPNLVGKDVIINGETRTIASMDIQGHFMTLTTPLSSAPAANLPITTVNSYSPRIDYHGQVQTRYPDNLITSRHTYYGQQFIERHNRYLSTNGSISLAGTGTDTVESFNVDITGNGGWDQFATYPFLFGGVFGGLSAGVVPSVTKDPTTEIIYAMINQALHKIVPSTTGPNGNIGSGGTYTSVALPNEFNPGSFTSLAVDTTRNRLFWAQPTLPRTINLSDNSINTHTFSGAGAAAFSALGGEGIGLIYDPYTDYYYARESTAGSAVYQINPSTFEVTLLPVVGSSFPPVSTGSGGHGIYNKWQLLPSMRGILYIPQAGSNVWFLRLY